MTLMAVFAMNTMAQTWNIGYPNEEDVVATLTDGTLTISGTGDTKNYGFFDNEFTYAPWYESDQVLNVVIEDGITSIGDELFSHCHSLESITIPNSVIRIGDFAIFDCNSLTFITIPNSVKSIGMDALSATGLTSIIVLNPDPITISIDELAFEAVDMDNCILIVPTGSLELYKNAQVWENFLYITDDAGTIGDSPNLANLIVSAGALSPEFNPTTYNYRIIVPNSIENIELTAIPVSDNATVSGNGKKALNLGENTFEITVTTSLGSFVYKITITRLPTDYSLTPVKYDEITTGAETITYYDYVINANRAVAVIDQGELEYELTVGNFSGSLPLHFDLEDGKYTCDVTFNVNANSVYRFKLNLLNITYSQYNYDITTTTNYNSYGQPTSTTMSYRYHSCNVIASKNANVLSTTEIDLVGSGITSVITSDLTFIGNYIVTSLKEPSETSTFALFPNPVTDFITVSGLQGNETLRFYNFSGQLVITQKASSETEKVQVNNLPAGMYLLKMDNGQTLKFLKK